MGPVVNVGLWVGAIGCGVMAGIYFAFSTFIMRALEGIPRSAGIAAMQTINEVIVASPFLPLFFGTSLVAAGLAGWSLLRWSEPGATVLLLGGLVYLVGMFVCTVLFNVPLNDALASVDPSSLAAEKLWPEYLRDWTRWNHLRTVASILASGLFTLGLISKL